MYRNVSRHYLHDPKANRLVRSMFAAASFPGEVRAIVLFYYLRTGVDLGSDFVSVLPAASRITCPVLLISGRRDWIVPTEDARRIFAALQGNRKSLVIIPNAVHDTTYGSAPELYQTTVLGFLDNSLAK